MRHSNRTLVDLDALADLFAHRVAGASDLIHIGLSGASVHDRCRPGGPWQNLLPGVLLLGSSPPTRAQLIQAALRFAGPRAVVSGPDALQLHGMSTLPATGPVHVLVPRDHRVRGTALVRAECTGRLPDPVLRKGFLTAPLGRAAVDTVRGLRSRDDVRAVLTEVVRRTGVSPVELRAELEAGGARGRVLAREVLASLLSAPAAWQRRRPPLGIPQRRYWAGEEAVRGSS